MALTDPVLVATMLTRIGQQLLSVRAAYSDPSAVLVGNPPSHHQLDEWQQQLAECAAAWDSALDVVQGVAHDNHPYEKLL